MITKITTAAFVFVLSSISFSAPSAFAQGSGTLFPGTAETTTVQSNSLGRYESPLKQGVASGAALWLFCMVITPEAPGFFLPGCLAIVESVTALVTSGRVASIWWDTPSKPNGIDAITHASTPVDSIRKGAATGQARLLSPAAAADVAAHAGS